MKILALKWKDDSIRNFFFYVFVFFLWLNFICIQTEGNAEHYYKKTAYIQEIPIQENSINKLALKIKDFTKWQLKRQLQKDSLVDLDDKTLPALRLSDLFIVKTPSLPSLKSKQQEKEPKTSNQDLSTLYHQLQQTADSKKAFYISQLIEQKWQDTHSESINLLLNWSQAAMLHNENNQALDLLDNVIALKPDLAEAWLRRAFIHVENYDLSLAMLDLAQGLKANPKNYNILALLGTIMEMCNYDHLAVKAYEQALEIYPTLSRVQKRLSIVLERLREIPV